LVRSQPTRFLRKLGKAFAHPRVAWDVLRAISKGACWRVRARCFWRRLKIGTGFRVVRKFVPSGPGRILIGNDVISDGGPHPVTLFTHSPQAEIHIGNGVFLNGTRFGCALRIEVGDDCILADCRIFDTDMHSIWPDRNSGEAVVATAPVRIAKNVWIGAAAIILKGVTIGENSVIGAGSVVVRDVPPNCIAAGNPARVVKRLGPGPRSSEGQNA
jgi:acetyltransferase-like isoleucine patch superfamily enzyme